MVIQSILVTRWRGQRRAQRMTGDRPPPVTPIQLSQRLLALPFDALRFQYAGAVSAGLAPRSIVDSGRWERRIDALEKLTLGPFARQR